MSNINKFKKGDRIVRVEPTKRFGDRSYVGDEMIFVGIANGMIYLQNNSSLHKLLFGDKLVDIPIDEFGDGWDYFFDPQIFLRDVDSETNPVFIQQLIDKAIKDEDYKLAQKLTDKLNNINNMELFNLNGTKKKKK